MTDSESDLQDDPPAPGAAPTESDPRDPGETARPARRGLWEVMGKTTPETSTEPKVQQPADAEPTKPDGEPIPSRDEVLGGTDPEPSRSEHSSGPSWSDPAWRGAGLAVIFGVLALPLAALAIRPEPWAGVPALLFGFLGAAFGLSILTGRRSRRRGWVAVVAGTGTLAGIVGALLGPLAFAPWGADQRLTHGRQATRQSLDRLGTALADHVDRHEIYPYAGRPENSAAGLSWATELLPSLERGGLYDSIDRDQSYASKTNAEAMRTVLPEFLAGGREPELIGSQFGPIHFAGVGGRVTTEDGRTRRLGVFGPDPDLRERDISDGLAQTLAIGEIRTNIPPWGEPANYRGVGFGLNVDPEGFGNADNTGAMFLHADGSVRFYPNDTDSEILRRLSTRDGEEDVDLPAVQTP